MKTRRSLIIVMLAALAMSIAALFFGFQPNTAHASRNSSGTTTDETEWTDKTNHTTGNLITIGGTDTSKGDRYKLENDGWQNVSGSGAHAYAVWYQNTATLENSAYGWGIQANDGSNTNEIGNEEYGNGVTYPITLSEADKVKADKGDLKISASAVYYKQTTAKYHNVSLKLFFKTAAGADNGSKEMTASITNSAYSLSISDYVVPVNTAKIEYYVSNWGSASYKPFIGGLSCTLKDGKDPGISTLAIDKSGIVDEKNNVAIAGNTVKYSINFSEKISVNSYGTAKLCLKGTTIATSSPSKSVITKNGKSTVCYSFTLPELGQSGKLAFSVEELNVEDESGRAYTYTNTSVNLTSLQYYAPMSVSSTINNLTFSGGTTASYGTKYSATLKAAAGYNLPSSVSVKVGGSAITKGYTYSNGIIIIDGKSIKGDIVITADGVPKTSTVTLDWQNGRSGTSSTTATYDAAMPAITLPTRTGYTFQGYFAQPKGVGKRYYDKNGNSTATCDFYEATTLYAHWQANTYTIKYMQNKPSKASHEVAGSTDSSSHIYDQSKALTANGYSLTGWHFRGWAKTATGAVEYTDGASVKNLTSANGSTVILYAVWQANTYTIVYNSNKPENASGSITESMPQVTHTYDTAKKLSDNQFTLTGYTFCGWAKNKTGAAEYTNGEEVKNLTSANGGAVTLYAVWKANTYKVVYNSNKPEGASGNITGAMLQVTHTYDTAKNLAANGYSLTGYTFRGWAETENGEVKYTDGVSVKNLTSANGGTVTLYAVWQANTYTIVYNSNKPEGASGRITETMPQSKHTYDTAKNLSDNQFTLTGWHFCGWAKTANGAAEYTNGQKINNLTDKDGGTVALYAVWQAKTYTIKFNTDGGNFVQETSATFDSVLPNAGIPARKGYRFCGYFSQAGGKGVQFYDASGKAAENKTYAEDRNIELYAYWSVISYNIDLYSGGRYVKTLENVAFDHLCLPSAAALSLSREHYNFVGWNLYDNQDWKMFSADVVYTVGIGYEQGETVTLYAAWKEKNVYSVNYDANGGGGAPGVEQKHEDETFALSDTIPTRENYTFLGWARTPDANSADYPAGFVNKLTMGGEPITLYAVWKRNPSLSFDANGGAFSSAPEIRYPAAGSEESIPSAAPEKAGHIFAGWSTKKDASIADYPADGSKKITMPDADTLLYAVWQKRKYTITHAVASSDFKIVGLLGEYEYESAATFTIQTAASATGKPIVYVNGELLAAKNGEYTFTVRGESHVFVAAADGSALTLVYSANGGTGAPYDNHVYQSGDTATILPTTPTRYGYTFLGWAAEQNAEVAQYKKGETYTFAGASAVLYAVWKANAYTVIYNANGGAGDMQNGEFTFGTKGALAKNSFAKIGYTFVGWSLSQNGAAAYKDGAEIADLCADENGAVTLYAVWEQTVTQISFDAESGKENNGTLSVAYGEELTGEKLTFPTRSGYKFAGYFTQRGGAGEEIFDAALNAVVSGGWNKNLTALTLYAGWQPISYTIVYMNGADKVKSQTAVYDTSFNLLTAADLAITPSQAYHHFAGWTTAPSGQVVMYADGQKISDPLSATDGEEVIFYAVFAKNAKYSVLYNANGGSNAPVDATTYYAGETVTFSTVKPEKEGYNFEGWSFDPNRGALIHAETVMQEGGITLYAVWQAGETLTAQINAVKSANASLKTSLDSLTGTVTGENGLSEKIADLLTRMTAAESLLDTLNNTTIAALRTEIANLKSTLEAADETLSERISAVEKRLTAETGNLTNLIGQKANQSDFASLKEAFDAAKTLLDSEIETRGKKDAKLAEKITALQSSYDTLSQKLTKEIQKVTDTIQAKVTELKEGKADKTALTELSKAFDNANTWLSGQVADLFSEHDILNGRVASLETTYNLAITELRQQISDLNTQLTAAVSDLTNKKADKTALTELSEAYKAADTILKGELENRLAEKDAALKGELENLKVSYAAADTALQKKINDVQRQLNEAAQKISDLNSQKANQSDFASLKESFESAEALLNSEIAARTNKDDTLNMKDAELEAKDAKLEAKIADLTNALHTAQSALETKINEVNRRLDEAIRDLNASIASNASNVEEKLAAAKRAYEAADVVICGEIASLKDKDTELSGQISALELSCKAADEALWAGIRQVQENLESLRAGMESKNNELGNDIDSVGAENERLIFLNVVFYVVLGVTVLTSVLVSKVRKPLKKHRK